MKFLKVTLLSCYRFAVMFFAFPVFLMLSIGDTDYAMAWFERVLLIKDSE